jgi:hypothetical protein
MTPGSVDLIECDDDLERDQHHHNQFEAQRSAGVDDVGEGVGGFGHHGEFPVERIDAFLEFIFVLKPGIKTLEVRALPQRIRLFSDRDATGYPVLDQQRISDQLQNLFSIPSGSSVIGQFLGEWFDDLEYFRDLAFVIGERDAFRQHIGNDKKPLQQHVPQLNRSSGLNLIFGSTGECDDSGFFLKTLKLATDSGFQPFQKAGFIFRGKTDQHRDAIAEENGDAGLPDPDRERNRRKSLIPPSPRACRLRRQPIIAAGCSQTSRLPPQRYRFY